jgi:PAS domain S-box-containing protein
VKIRARILWTLLGVCLLILVVGSRAISRQRDIGSLEASTEAGEDARVLALIVATDRDRGQNFAQKIAYYTFEDDGRDVEAVDTQKRIIADSHPEEIGRVSDHPHDELDRTLQDGQSRTFTEAGGRRMIVEPVKTDSGQIIGAVTEEYTPIYDEFMAMTETTTRQVVLGSLAGVALSVALALYLGASLARPLRQLTRAAVAFAADQPDVPMPPPRNDEIGDLGVAFNVMIERRREAGEALGRERRRLVEILDSVPGMVFEHWSLENSSRNFVSNYVETMYGYTAAEWLSTPDFWTSRVHPEDREWVVKDARGIFSDGKGLTRLQFRWLTKDERVIWCDTYLTVIRDPVDGSVGVRGFSLDITAQKLAQNQLDEAHHKLLDASRLAGMAEVATSVLHNVGNVLNSVNVSATMAAEHVRNSSAPHVGRVADLLAQKGGDLASYLTTDPSGRKLPAFLGQLAVQIEIERSTVLTELEQLVKNVEHIKDIVAMQQSYATAAGVSQTVPVVDLVEDSIRMNAGALTRHDVQLVRDYQSEAILQVDKHKVIQILVNLIRNAKYACDDSGRAEKLLTLRISDDAETVRITVIDNGVGIPEENLTRIFSHGFTTRANGHGYGLHSSALAASELGGALLVNSEGSGCGATFTLELPFTSPKSDHAL